MEWLVSHWDLVVSLLLIVISVLNAVTKHWTSADSTAGKVLLRITELLSFLKSADVPGLLKLPLTSKKPEV